MKERRKGLLQAAAVLIAGGAIGILLLMIVYGIPVPLIMENYSASLESIDSREGWHQYISGYAVSTLDNNTEFLMLKAAATPLPATEENYIQKVLRCYTFNSEWNHGLAFAQGEYDGQSFTCDSYERYWHGYLVLLKPLLVLFTYQDLIYLNILLQFVLMFLLLGMLRKREMAYLQIPFLLLWIVGMQLIVMLSLDYSVCFYIYMVSTLLLLRYRKLRERYGLFFLGVGMLTSYMDLLTWPLVTLTVPLMILLQYESGIGDRMKRMVSGSFAWGVGYSVQWAFKWLAATLFLDDNVIADAVESLLFRSALEGEKSLTWGHVVMKNLSVFWNTPCLLLGGIMALLTVFLVYKNRGKLQWANMIPCLLIGISPFLWYLVTRNHAYEHYWMTWRNLSITVLAMYGGLAEGIRRDIL